MPVPIIENNANATDSNINESSSVMEIETGTVVST